MYLSWGSGILKIKSVTTQEILFTNKTSLYELAI